MSKLLCLKVLARTGHISRQTAKRATDLNTNVPKKVSKYHLIQFSSLLNSPLNSSRATRNNLISCQSSKIDTISKSIDVTVMNKQDQSLESLERKHIVRKLHRSIIEIVQKRQQYLDLTSFLKILTCFLCALSSSISLQRQLYRSIS